MYPLYFPSECHLGSDVPIIKFVENHRYCQLHMWCMYVGFFANIFNRSVYSLSTCYLSKLVQFIHLLVWSFVIYLDFKGGGS